MKNLCKRMLAMGLAASMVLQGIPAGTAVAEAAEAAEAANEEIAVVQAPADSSEDVVDSGTCGEDLTWVLDIDGTLTISGTGEMDEYFYDYDKAPWYGQDISAVVIESGVTSIGDWAFYGCDELKNVTIPDSVTTIGFASFNGCSSLTSLVIPDSATSIEGAFYGCSGLENVIIPNGVTTIQDTFSGCSSLKSITIPNSVTSIGEEAFYGCSSLKSVTIPDSVTIIDSSAFYGCSSLVNVTIPDSVISIEGGAFSGCSSLTSVIIPDSVTSIDSDAFYNCSSLASITLSNNLMSIGSDVLYGTAYYNDKTNWEDGVLYWGKYLLDADEYNLTGSCEIKDGTILIADSAFMACTKVESISIPDSVTVISRDAFYRCISMTNVSIPDSVTIIDSWAFARCSSLTSITIPDSVTFIGDDAFCECVNLNNVIIPDSVTSIEYGTFEGCSSLASVTLPDNLVSIGSEAFYDTAYYNDEANWEDGVLYYGKYLLCADADNLASSYEIKDGTILLAGSAFYRCENLVSISIPEGVITIGQSTFEDCYGLTKVTIPDGVTSIGQSAFDFCYSLTSVTIPVSVLLIDESAFNGCFSLSDVYYKGTEEQWNSITINWFNDGLDDATIHYNSTGSEAGAESIDISSCTITLSSTSYTYNGSAKKPTVTVKDGSTTLVSGTDYTVAYSNNTNAGTATVTVTGQGDYTGTVTKNFTISKASQTVSVKSKGSTSIKAGKTTTWTAKTSGNGAITYSTTASSSVGTVNSSTGKVTAKGVGTIKVYATAAATSNYKASSKTLIATITVGLTTPTISSVVQSNTAVTVKWAKITGAKGYYVYRSTSKSGTYSKVKTITSGSTVSYKDTSTKTSGKTYYYKVYAYSGSTQSSASSVKSIKYMKGTVSSLTNVSSGITVKWSKVSGATGYYVYRKASTASSYTLVKKLTGGSTVSYTDTGVKSKNGTTYTYYVQPYNSSSNGAYATMKTVRMTAVSLSSVKNTSSKKMTVKWSKNTKATGYQIQYSTSSTFASGNKTVTVTGASSSSKVIGSLTKTKTYYVRIRSYKTVSGTKYTSAWSTKKSVKISK